LQKSNDTKPMTMTTLPNDDLELAAVLYKHMLNREFSNGIVTGTLDSSLDFDDVVQRLGDKVRSQNPATKRLEWHPPKGRFFNSLDDVLTAPARRIAPPERFYLIVTDQIYRADQDDLPVEIRNYFTAAKLYSLLMTVADHHGGASADAKTLIFLNGGKVEITPQYSVADLHELGRLDDFEREFIVSDAHKDQKQTIIKTVLAELFTGRNKFPFSELLARFDDFFGRVQSNYQLYVAEFSFHKVKDEVEKEKLDAMIKLNKVFSDIQNQLLAIPVALVLVGGQMEDKGSWTSKNILIWIGVLVFSILMSLLVSNQRNTLKAVKDEIDQQKRQIETKYRSIAARFNEVYEEIDRRHLVQKRLILVVDVLVAISFLITTGMLLLLSGVIQLP